MAKIVILLTLTILNYNPSFSQSDNGTSGYPKIVEYVSFVHPIFAFDKNTTTFNFSSSYNIGFPVGINVIQSRKIGFSFEVTPFIKFQNDTAKVNFVLFHPGIMFRFNHSFTIITRLAFETTGRFGFTPVFNKVMWKSKNINYFTALATPLRIGNAKPVTIGLAWQLGVSF